MKFLGVRSVMARMSDSQCTDDTLTMLNERGVRRSRAARANALFVIACTLRLPASGFSDVFRFIRM